jgi:hypothetical protein
LVFQLLLFDKVLFLLVLLINGQDFIVLLSLTFVEKRFEVFFFFLQFQKSCRLGLDEDFLIHLEIIFQTPEWSFFEFFWLSDPLLSRLEIFQILDFLLLGILFFDEALVGFFDFILKVLENFLCIVGDLL